MSAEYQSLAEAVGIEDRSLRRAEQTGWRLYEERRYREAATVFRGLTILDPENVDLYRGHALAAAKCSDLVEASEALTRAATVLEAVPGREADLGQVLAVLASVLYRSGRRDEARTAAARAVDLSPEGAPWLSAVSEGLQRVEKINQRSRGPRPEEAKSFRKAIRSRLADVGRGHRTLANALGYGDRELLGFFDSGSTLMASGEAVRARRVFEGLVSLDGGVPLFHLALAKTKEAMEDHMGAKAAYDAAIASARKVEGGVDVLADAVLRRAAFFLRIGDQRRAERDLKGMKALPSGALGPELKSRYRALCESAGLKLSEGSRSGRIKRRSSAVRTEKSKAKSNASAGVGQRSTSRPNAKR